MGARHVPELGDAVLDPTSGSAQVGGPSMLTQCEEGLLAAEAPGSWLLWLINLTVVTARDSAVTRPIVTVTHPSQHPSRARVPSLRLAGHLSCSRGGGIRHIPYMSVLALLECRWVYISTWVYMSDPAAAIWIIFLCTILYWTRFAAAAHACLSLKCQFAAGSLTFVSPKTKVRSKTYFLF